MKAARNWKVGFIFLAVVTFGLLARRGGLRLRPIGRRL